MRECRATSLGLVERGKSLRKDGDRSFVLTRSFFAGSQRWGPLWTGDNVASWDALRVSVPMVLALNLAGFPWAGTARLAPAVATAPASYHASSHRNHGIQRWVSKTTEDGRKALTLMTTQLKSCFLGQTL